MVIVAVLGEMYAGLRADDALPPPGMKTLTVADV